MTIPLCDGHHSRYKKTGFHNCPADWEDINGTQYALLEQIKELVAKGNPWEF